VRVSAERELGFLVLEIELYRSFVPAISVWIWRICSVYDIEIVCGHGLRELCEPSQVIEIELRLCPFDGFFDVIPESGHDIEFEHL